MIKGVQEAMALQTLLRELGLKATITVHTDSSAAKASAEKPGLLHMKHVQVVQEDLVVIEKVNTLWNPADMLTREFEVNMVEVDAQDEPGSWWSLLWLGLAVIGMIWVIKTGGELFSAAVRRERREPTMPLRRRDSPRIRGSTRTIACMTMSTRMKGSGLRFQPTKASDEGAFINDVPVNQNVEMDGEVRGI